MIRILLVDDQPQVRRGLRMNLALEPDFEVVGEAADGNAAMSLASSLHPDVVVMDVEMPGIDAITITQALSSIEPHCAVLILSIHDDAHTQIRAYTAGAAAFVSKRESPERLTAAIRHVVSPNDPN
jgi:DNA-binding NarL/FixJ family response regulator